MRVRRGCQASQRKGLTSGEVRELPGKFGELPGKFGKLPGNLWIAVKFHSERSHRKTSGEVRGTSGEVRGLPRSSGQPDSLPATRQICLRPGERFYSRALNGGFKWRGFRIWTRPSRFFLFCPVVGTFRLLLDFPHLSGDLFSRFVPFLFLSLLKHLQRTVTKGSATRSGPFPKQWETPWLENPPGLASPNL